MSNIINLLDYLHKLEIVNSIPSEVRAICPICGQDKFKISTKTGMGSCFSNCCDIRDIFEAIGAPTFNTKKRYTYISQVETPAHIELLESKYKSNTIKHDVKFSNVYGELIQEIDYIYDDIHKIYRINLLRSKEKNVFPNTFNLQNNRWEIKADPKFPFFNERYLTDKSKFIIVVEGEKTSDTFSSTTNILSITPPLGFGWSNYWLNDNIKRIAKQIAGFIVIPDNDLTGIKKARNFQMVCFSNYIPCKILDLSDYYLNKNDDLVDLIERDLDVVQIIHSKINNNGK